MEYEKPEISIKEFYTEPFLGELSSATSDIEHGGFDIDSYRVLSSSGSDGWMNG